MVRDSSFPVFLSHTSRLAGWPETRSCVQAARDAVNAAGMVAVDMQYFPASPMPPIEVCLKRLKQCRLLVLLLGFDYGSRVPGGDWSYIEAEFDAAATWGIPRIAVLLRESAAGPALIDKDHTKIDLFRQKVVSSESLMTVCFVDNADQIEYRVYQALKSGSPDASVVG